MEGGRGGGRVSIRSERAYIGRGDDVTVLDGDWAKDV